MHDIDNMTVKQLFNSMMKEEIDLLYWALLGMIESDAMPDNSYLRDLYQKTLNSGSGR